MEWFSDINNWLTLISVLAALGGIASSVTQLLSGRTSEKKEAAKEVTVERTADEIEREITQRRQHLAQLKEDTKTYEDLLKVMQPEVEAIKRVLRNELKQQERSSFWAGFWMNFAFFILGSVSSILITLWLTPK